MARIALLSGDYLTRSVIASTSRSINLYPEANPQSVAPTAPVTHYGTPGLRPLGMAPGRGPCRCLYRTTTGDLYACIGDTVYFIDAGWNFTSVGTLVWARTPVSMSDNGDVLVIVDGSTLGYVVELSSRAYSQILDDAFYGADKVDYLDTYFVFNRPGTNQFYISLSSPTFANFTGTPSPNTLYPAFDPLDIAGKTGGADRIITIASIHRELWLIGEYTTEVWGNSGGADFAFSEIPGSFMDHGCLARYSVTSADVALFWLSRDRQGKAMVVQGAPYNVKRISTHALEEEIQRYPRLDDAQAYTYQQEGHTFYVLTFPAADKTWVYDLDTEQWHMRAWRDDNGELRRHRSNCFAEAYGESVVGDFESGKIYALDTHEVTDDGRDIVCLRRFPHIMGNGKRVEFSNFTADIEVAIAGATDTDPLVSLRWSNDRGRSWGNPVMRSLGKTGEFQTWPTWYQLGMARDRVFELSFNRAYSGALNGAFVEAKPAET